VTTHRIAALAAVVVGAGVAMCFAPALASLVVALAIVAVVLIDMRGVARRRAEITDLDRTPIEIVIDLDRRS
jgi:hypothetical protein